MVRFTEEGRELRATSLPWEITVGASPLVAVALHGGHNVREEVEAWLEIPEEERAREEDLHSSYWTEVSETRVVVHRSRFEVDLNRERELAVYLRPEDAWGLEVWRDGLPREIVERSLELYDSFYQELRSVFEETGSRFGRFLVYDLHSYNHRRAGPHAGPEPQDGAPDVNVGTGSLDRDFWEPVVDRFLRELRASEVGGRRLDVRENVRFRGRQLAAWTHAEFPREGCVLALEVKKFYMDEWTGELFPRRLEEVLEAFERTKAPVFEEMERL